MFETTWKGIRVPSNELENWNPKLLHFYLKNPYYFPEKFLEMIDFCRENDIKITLDKEDELTIAEWRTLINEIRNK